jgi:hypothetical protein
MSVSELPPFPEDPETLRDIRRWSRSRVFDGETYGLTIEVLDFDTSRPVESVDEIPPGSTYAAWYGRRVQSRLEKRGPSYLWGPGGEVYEQGYWGRDRREARVYDPAGRVMTYQYSHPDPRASWLSCSKRPRMGAGEHFDPSGKLVGFFTNGKHYWRGVEREPLEYSDSLRNWNPWVAWRDSVRRSESPR